MTERAANRLSIRSSPCSLTPRRTDSSLFALEHAGDPNPSGLRTGRVRRCERTLGEIPDMWQFQQTPNNGRFEASGAHASLDSGVMPEGNTIHWLARRHTK